MILLKLADNTNTHSYAQTEGMNSFGRVSMRIDYQPDGSKITIKGTFHFRWLTAMGQFLCPWSIRTDFYHLYTDWSFNPAAVLIRCITLSSLLNGPQEAMTPAMKRRHKFGWQRFFFFFLNWKKDRKEMCCTLNSALLTPAISDSFITVKSREKNVFGF